ncbi:hypothetical protein P3S68_029161 [Capsicum galapagoense]
MPVCFGLKEFAIVTGLRCDRPEELLIKETPHKESNKRKDLMADLKNKDIPKHYREKLCLVWFVHSILLARDVRKVIEHDLLVLANDFRKLNDYPWGYDFYYLTAFMAWACEAISPLRKKLKAYPDKVSHPRILRWLGAIKYNKKYIKEADLFNTPDNAVHGSSVAIDYLSTTTGATDGAVDTKEDPTVNIIKKKLAGETSIRRAVRQGQPNVEALHNQPQTATDPCASSVGLAGGVVCNGGSHPDAAASHDYEHVGAQQKINTFENSPCTGPHSHPYTDFSHLYSGPSHPSSPSYCHCKCKVCKDEEAKLLKKLEAIAEAVEELKSGKGVIPSNEVREPCTPTVAVRRKRRKIRQILSVLKSAKITTRLALRVVEFQRPSKKVDIFAALGKKKKKELEKFMKTKVQTEYTMHSFAAKDFKNMTNMHVRYEDNYVDEILCLMRERQLAYPDAYDAADRIMKLNFYNNFKDRYASLCKDAFTSGSGFDELVSKFQWDEEMIKYVRGKRSYPHDKSWNKAKRILAVMNVDVAHFLIVEILLYEEKIKVYDCNLPIFSKDKILADMQPLLKLLLNLLKQSKLMDHLPAEVLTKESWDFEGRNNNIQLPRNTIGAACGPYSLAYIECLLTGTQMTGMCDEVVGKMHCVWAYGVLTKWLEPVYKEEYVQIQR